MRIQELEIDQFGVWKNVTLPFSERGITVLYGPNEAGKSTLMRFIRGVLFGYQPGDVSAFDESGKSQFSSGVLRVTHLGKRHEIRRTAEKGSRGRLEVDGQRMSQQDPLMQSLIGRSSEAIFRDVFAIGLHELQELATLDNAEIAQQVYGLSLGREGDQLVRAQGHFASQANHIANRETRKGELFGLVQRMADIDRQLERVGVPLERHRRLQEQIEKHDDRIEQLKQRQKFLQCDLRGFQFLSRVWEPWKKETELRARLEQLPNRDLDLKLVGQLDDLELSISDVESQRQTLLDEARKHQKQSQDIKLAPELEEQQCAIQRLHDELPEAKRIADRFQLRPHDLSSPSGDWKSRFVTEPSAQQPSASARQKSSKGSKQRDNSDSKITVDGRDVSPERIQELMDAANAYRNALRSRKRLSRKYKAYDRKYKQFSNELAIDPARNDSNAAAAVLELQRLEKELEKLKGLHVEKRHLQSLLDQNPESGRSELVEAETPPFFRTILWFFAITGSILTLCGLYGATQGVVIGGFHAAIIGACYALLGISALATCWTMKVHYSRREISVTNSVESTQSLRKEIDDRNMRIQQIISRQILARKSTIHPLAGHHVADEQSIAQKLEQLVAERQGYEKQTSEAARIQRWRRRMSKLRDQMRKSQSIVNQRRSEWVHLLRSMGLAEKAKPTEVIAECQWIFKQQLLSQKPDQMEFEVLLQRERLSDFLERVARLSGLLNSKSRGIHDPFEQVTRWKNDLDQQYELRRERSRLRQLAKEKKGEADKVGNRLESLYQQRTRRFADLGISSREEIATILSSVENRDSLKRQLQEIGQTIARIVEGDPDLMIVEEQLQDFDEQRNREQIAEIREELLKIDESLQVEYQSVGRVNQELKSIEEDRTAALLRFDRAQLAEQIRLGSERLLGVQVADNVVGTLRSRIEKERQPKTLQEASASLQQLTCGKYQNIWTPLNEKKLLVDDDAGNSFQVEQLSSGTREQVFLSLRLAMIRDLAQRDVELPMVLDDVTVNFDQMRTEAAVETLLNVAETGQQIILFTCHLHLAHLFEQHHIDPVWLPSNRPEISV